MVKLPFVGSGTQGLDSESHHLFFDAKGLAISLIFVFLFFANLPTASAWWSASYASRVPITFVLAGTAAKDNLLQFEHIDFTAYNFSCIDLNDMHIVDESSDIDLNISIEGTSDMTDGNITIELDVEYVAGTYANEFYMYYNNGDCLAARKRLLLTDSNSLSDWDVITDSTHIDASIQTFDNNTGNTIKFATHGDTTDEYFYITPYNALTADSFGLWMKTSNIAVNRSLAVFMGTMPGAMFARIQVDGVNTLDFIGFGVDWPIFAPANNTWYYVIFKRDDSTHLSAYAYNEFGVLQGSIVNKEASPGYSWNQPTTINLNIKDTAVAVTSWYNGIYVGANAFPYTAGITSMALGAVESGGSDVIDANVNTIEGLPFANGMSFSYAFDGNLSVGFSILQSSNKRVAIDLNYSSTIAQGTGDSIKTDYNLTSADCDTIDWAVVPANCVVEWPIESFDVNTFYLNLLAKAIGETDFNHSNFAVSIINDVNIIVKVPIDEETGLPINTDHLYRWTVRIWDDSGMRYYQNQIDQNGFWGPLGSTITIEIDTNTSDFYSRQYSLTFNDPISTYTLQPYLVKQAVSGNFIFNVTDATTIAPISGVEIRIFGFIPDLGTQGIQAIITDSSGLATIPLRLNSPYTAEFYYNGSLVHSAGITPTSASLFYQVSLNIATISIPPIDIGAIKVLFEPTTAYALRDSSGRLDLNAMIYIVGKTIQSIRIRVFDSNGCRYDDNTFTGPWTDGNKVSFMVDTNHGNNYNIFYGFDCGLGDDYSVYMIVDVNSTDGNQFSMTSIWWRVPPAEYQWDLLYRLALTAGLLNAPGTKTMTSIIALMIVFSSAGVITKLGGGDTFVSTIFCLAVLGIFVYISWIEFLPFIFISIAALFISLYAEAR